MRVAHTLVLPVESDSPSHYDPPPPLPSLSFFFSPSLLPLSALQTGKKGVKLVKLLTTSNNAGAGNNYRADLTKAALARFSQLSRAEARKASQARKAVKA